MYRRKTEFNKATIKSKELNKKLIVIGSPYTGFMNKMYPNYGCGDICIDINGCNDCKNQFKNDVTEVLRKLPDNKYVIFESCVLEYVKNKKEALKEIKRVAGDNYYQVRIKPTFLPSSYFDSPFIEHGLK